MARGLITDADRRNFLQEKYEESIQNRFAKELKKARTDQYYSGVCPYCGKEHAVFTNEGEVVVDEHPYVKATCATLPEIGIEGCGKQVYIDVSLQQDGDLFTGVKYTPFITIYKPDALPAKKMPKPKPETNADPKPQKVPNPGSKFKPATPPYQHVLPSGKPFILGWARLDVEKKVPKNIRNFVEQFDVQDQDHEY